MKQIGKNVSTYFEKMYEMRFFIRHLVVIGLKNKFRRSKLGILWTFISPLCLTIIMSVVFSTAFKINYGDYLPYILSGIVFWELVSSSFIGGGNTIMGFESFIRQCNHPISLYTLTNSLIFTISFFIASFALVVISVFGHPLHVLLGLVIYPLTLVIYLLLSWGATTIAAYVGVQYRDYPMAIGLFLQVVWYMSPVFLAESMFESNEILYTWFQINPITHLLNLIREPFLYGKLPSAIDYVYSILFVVCIDILAVLVNNKKEKNAIFYL